MAETHDETTVEPWEGYDEASAEDLIDAAGRKRSTEKLRAAVEYERAGKNRSTVIAAFEQRADDLGDSDDSDDEDVKGQPGEARPGDVTSPASEQDTAERQGTGQVAAKEAEEHQARRAETAEKIGKAESEGGATPTSVSVPIGAGVPTIQPVYAEENRQDRIEVAGHQYRDGDDVEPDPGYVFDTDEAKANAKTVDHLTVASGTEGIYLDVDGDTLFFDVDLGLALSRLVSAAATNLNN